MEIWFVAKDSFCFQWPGLVVPKICSVKNVHETTPLQVFLLQRGVLFTYSTGFCYQEQDLITTIKLLSFRPLPQFTNLLHFFFFFLFHFASFLLICLSLIFSQEQLSTLCCTFWQSNLQDCVIICASHWNISPGASLNVSHMNARIMTFNNHLSHPCTQHAM